MSGESNGSGAIAKIAGGVAVFVVCWIIQATQGDSSMFSMSYVDRGLVPGLLVNAPFWPGWIFTAALIGAGVSELLDLDSADS